MAAAPFRAGCRASLHPDQGYPWKRGLPNSGVTWGKVGHNSPGAESLRCGNCLRVAPKSPSNAKRTFFNTVNLLAKDLRFEHGGAKLASCHVRYLTLWRPSPQIWLRTSVRVYTINTPELNSLWTDFTSGVRRKFSWGVSFSGIWWSFAFGVRCLWRHNLTSYSCFQTNVVAKFVDITGILFYTHSP